MKFRGEDVTIQEAADTAFKGVDIVLGAAENDIAKKFAPADRGLRRGVRGTIPPHSA